MWRRPGGRLPWMTRATQAPFSSCATAIVAARSGCFGGIFTRPTGLCREHHAADSRTIISKCEAAGMRKDVVAHASAADRARLEAIVANRNGPQLSMETFVNSPITEHGPRFSRRVCSDLA